MATKGKRLTLLVACAGVVTLFLAAALYWGDFAARRQEKNFEQLFDQLPGNERAYSEYRHRETEIVFVKVPGGKLQNTAEPSKEAWVAPFLTAKGDGWKAAIEPLLSPTEMFDFDLFVFLSKARLEVASETQLARAAAIGILKDDEPVIVRDVAPGFGVIYYRFHPVYNLKSR